MIAIIGDTHIGAHNSSIDHHLYMEKFFIDFFMYADKHKIKEVIQLGDLFDVRKHINTWSLNYFRRVFIEPVISRGMHVYVLVGNHDIFYRESISISSVKEILSPYSEWFTVVDEPSDVIIGSESFLLVPWVCRENKEAISIAIEKSSSKYCAGHFEFDGFELFKGHPAKSEYSHSEYKKFDKVFSGHFHHGSTKDNVIYTGTPYELTWQDANCTKSFYIIDNHNIVPVVNKHAMYAYINSSELDSINKNDITNKHIKLTIDTKVTNKEREKIINSIYIHTPLSVKIIELYTEDEINSNVSTYNVHEPITNMLSEYVDTSSINQILDKGKLKNMLFEMYNVAIGSKQ